MAKKDSPYDKVTVQRLVTLKVVRKHADTVASLLEANVYNLHNQIADIDIDIDDLIAAKKAKRGKAS